MPSTALLGLLFFSILIIGAVAGYLCNKLKFLTTEAKNAEKRKERADAIRGLASSLSDDRKELYEAFASFIEYTPFDTDRP